MKRIFSRALVISAIAAVAALGADNSIGTWKVNAEKSKSTPAPLVVKSLTSVREAVPGGVKVTNSGERADGAAINATYTAKYDGSASAVTGSGAPYDSISVKQVNANTFTYEAKNDEWKVSRDRPHRDFGRWEDDDLDVQRHERQWRTDDADAGLRKAVGGESIRGRRACRPASR